MTIHYLLRQEDIMTKPTIDARVSKIEADMLHILKSLAQWAVTINEIANGLDELRTKTTPGK